MESKKQRNKAAAQKRREEREKKEVRNFWIITAAVLAAIALGVTLAITLPNKKTESNASASDAQEESTLAEQVQAYLAEHSDTEECFEAHEGEQYHHVELDVKDYGTISLELDETVAPISVANFLKLAEEGFYDGLTFHRIIDDFMVQGGDPLGNGTGGSDETIKGEFSANGVENTLSHTRGVVSMARSNDYDSASSQFFIVQADSTFLDGNYAAFGYVTEGIALVDAMCALTPVQDSNGTVDSADQPVITAVRVID